MNRNFLRTRYKIVPCSESITFTPMNPQQTAFTVSGARYKGAPNPAEFPSAGISVTTGWAIFRLPDVNMQGYQPDPGSLIMCSIGSAAAGTWIISGQIQPYLVNSDWEVLCTQQLAAG